MIHSILNFQYSDLPVSPIMPEYLGVSWVSDASYRWDGRMRQEHSVNFQYTLSGSGRLKVGGETYTITPGQGMLLIFPEEHEYYYDPALSDHWEFVWLQASGAFAFACWQEWRRQIGPVVALEKESPPIRSLLDLYERVQAEGMRDKYELSASVYNWCLSIFKQLERGSSNLQAQSSIETAKQFMETNYYRQQLTLDDIAASAGWTRTYFCKIFHDTVGVTPMAYLMRRRLEEAVRLLKYSAEPIAAVAVKTGFDNAGYFSKVFRRYLGVTPGAYRRSSGNSASVAFSDVIYVV